MGKIVLLDDLTINKIAAGEVIERPASCVKEMCENSIDAGAKNITVEIKNGGISLIKIIDDGCGISEDDMEISFERHATSKIRSADDLSQVKTMGFRGEALASISAISNVEMISKRPEDEIGHRIVVEGGKIIEKSECGAPNGTSITVKNLFFNTPVRYKFLKKDFTESGYIEDVINRLALVNKNVAIKLINTGKTVIQTNGNDDIKDVIYSIYGKDTAEGVRPIEYTYEDIKVSGVVGTKSIARSNRNGQLFFVNNRYVKDKTLSSAVDQAYKDILPTGKYGFVILNLEMDSSKVDCNVHPAKLEVRFEETQNVFKAVYHAIQSQNTEISKTMRRVTEIQNQEAFLDAEPKKEIEDKKEYEKKVEEEEFRPRSSAFSGFFKRFKNEKDEDNSLIKDIFEAKKNGSLNWNDFNNEKSDKVNETSNMNIEKNIENSNINENVEKNTENSNEDIIDNIEKNNNEEITETEEKNNLSNNIMQKFEIKKEISNESLDGNEINNDIAINDIQEVKLGNTIISSDTKESEYNMKALLKEIQKKDETMNFDVNDLYLSNSSKTEVIDSLKKIDDENNKETFIINTKEIRNDIELNPEIIEGKENVQPKENTEKIEIFDTTVTEKILEQKVKNDMDGTQFIDTTKIRSELYKNDEKEDIPMTNEFANMYKKVFGMDVSTIRKTKEEVNAKLDFSDNIQVADNIENENVFEQKENDVPKIKYRFIGTIFGDFSIIEVKDEMYMIEKTSAEERLMYEIVKNNFYGDEDCSVTLLLADIITLNPKEIGIARDLKMMFEKAGFEYEEFGDCTLKLTKVPSWAETLNTKKLFLEILNEMNTIAVIDVNDREEKFITAVSSKYVMLADTKLDEKGLEKLIKKLLSLDNPFMYPNGKLIAVKITKANMEKKFSRR